MQGLTTFGLTFVEPTTELYLIRHGIKEENTGFWYSIEYIAYAFSSFSVSLIPRYIQKSRIMAFGNFLQFLGFFLLGTAAVILKSSLSLIALGLFCIGFAGGFIYVPSVPNILDIAKDDYEYQNDERLNNAISGITTMSISIGEVLGPIFSSTLYQAIGYNYAAATVSVGILSQGFVYLYYTQSIKGNMNDISFELIGLSMIENKLRPQPESAV
jgi:MFS family permease